jgi:hypothetical protein
MVGLGICQGSNLFLNRSSWKSSSGSLAKVWPRDRQVGAGAERAAGAGHHQRPDRVVITAPLEHAVHLGPHLPIPGVEPIRPVEGGQAYPVPHLEEHGVFFATSVVVLRHRILPVVAQIVGLVILHPPERVPTCAIAIGPPISPGATSILHPGRRDLSVTTWVRPLLISMNDFLHLDDPETWETALSGRGINHCPTYIYENHS